MSEPTTKLGAKSGSLIFLSVILSLIAISISIHIYYQEIQQNQWMKRKVAMLTLHYNLQLQSNRQALNQLQQSNQAIQDRLNQLSLNQTGIIIYQINQLISLANQGLVVYNDVAGAIRLLNHVKNILNGNNNAIFAQLKFALASDLERLNQIPTIDTIMLNGQLDVLAKQVAQLHLTVRNNLPKPNLGVGQSKWQKFFYDIKNDIFGLVVITKVANTQTLALLPAQEAVVRQKIQIDLLNARIALLEHDTEAWQFSLTNAKADVSTYFTADLGATSILTKLNLMLRLNIGTNQANINATLQALNKLNNLAN